MAAKAAAQENSAIISATDPQQPLVLQVSCKGLKTVFRGLNIVNSCISMTTLAGLIAISVLAASLSSCSGVDSDRTTLVEEGLLPLVTSKDQAGRRFDIHERMLHYNVPGVSVAVFENGKIVWAEGYGTARPGEDIPVTETTLFQAASISKSVTAVGALLLVQNGTIDLDRDINEYLISWSLPTNSYTEGRDVSLRRLLNHSAGVTVHGFPGYSRDESVPTLVEVLNGDEPANTARIEIDVPVGDVWRYSGGGYTVIQQMLIDVTQQSFDQYMAENVLVPLGMRNSTFSQPLDKAYEAHAAWGYLPALGPVAGGYHVYPEMSAAGLWSTPRDLALFAIAVQQASAGQRGSILNRSLATEMITAKMGNYGFGVMVADKGPSSRFRHTGINQGFDSAFVAYSNIGTGAVVMTNSNLSDGLITEVIDSIAREYDWPNYPTTDQRQALPFSDEELANYPGIYEIDEGFDVEVVREGDRLFMHFPKQGHTEIYSSSDGKSQFVTGFPFPPFQLKSSQTGNEIVIPAIQE